MTEVREYFPEIDKMEVPALHLRREQLLNSDASFLSGKVGDYKDLKDEVLAELLAITRGLRKKAAAPGSSGGSRKAPAKGRAKTTLDDLA